MKCPRCNYEWDVRQGPCPRCSLQKRVPGLHSRSASRLVPLRASPSESSPANGDRTAQVRSSYLQEPASDSLLQSLFAMPSDRPQSSRFPLPSTGKLDPKQSIVPLPSDASVLSVQQALSTLHVSSSEEQTNLQPLLSGTPLHRDRYILQKNLHEQEWPLGIVETIWSAFDTRIAKSLVLIYELSISNDAPKKVQDIPYTATKSFTSIGRNIHVLPLRDVFSDKGRSFFVFEPVDGLSLLTLMFNSGRKLPEKEVVACCLQMVELLQVCLHQSPPLVHGNIRPEFIVRKSIDSQYVLTNFSVALAGGLAQIVAELEESADSPSFPHMLMRGKMDGRTDLYALLATAHYAVTGYWLSDINSMATGSDLSPQFRAILLKGLRSSLQQRYQSPSELYQDLLALYSAYQKGSGSQFFAVGERSTQPVAPTMEVAKNELADFIVPRQPIEEPPAQSFLMPLPEELPPLKEAHDFRNAVLWFAGMLFCLVILLGRGMI